MEWLTCPERTFFMTFTYEDSELPVTVEGDVTLEKKYFLKWIENVQREIGSFRYYVVGEYGELYGRPHYHMAVFPEHHSQVPALRVKWRKGFSSAYEINHARARYLANYTAKKLTKLTDERLSPGQEPEFRTSSRNPPLGSEFVKAIIKHYKSGQAAKLVEERGDVERCFRLDGRIYPLSGWPLEKIREALGIPLTHKGRAVKNENYLKFHEIQEAEWNPEEAEAQEVYLNAEKIRKTYRTPHAKL